MSPDETIGTLVCARPRALRILLGRGIDVLAEAETPVAESWARTGLDADALEREISDAEHTRPDLDRWEHAPLAELVDHIVTRYHRPFATDLARLMAWARLLAQAPGRIEPARIAVILEALECLRVELSPHLVLEEFDLFPRLLAPMEAAALAPVRGLFEAHDAHLDLLRVVRSQTEGYRAPPEADLVCRVLWQGLCDLEIDLMEHIYLENTILIPRGLTVRR